jgi:hypothetical protein
MSWFLLEMSIVAHPIIKFRTFYGTKSSVTCLEKLSTVSCMSQMNPVHTLAFCFWRSILMLFSNVHIGAFDAFLPSDFPTKMCIHAFFFYAYFMIFPFHPPWFGRSNNICRGLQMLMLSCNSSSIPLFSK